MDFEEEDSVCEVRPSRIRVPGDAHNAIDSSVIYPDTEPEQPVTTVH